MAEHPGIALQILAVILDIGNTASADGDDPPE
jgi:hypothetical protein